MADYGTDGPDHAEPAEFFCPDCDEEVQGAVEYFRHAPRVIEQRFFHYPVKGVTPVRADAHETEWEPVEPDEDAEYERERDRRMEIAPRFTPAPSSSYADSDPLYRQSMKDAGRGRMLR